MADDAEGAAPPTPHHPPSWAVPAVPRALTGAVSSLSVRASSAMRGGFAGVKVATQGGLASVREATAKANDAVSKSTKMAMSATIEGMQKLNKAAPWSAADQRAHQAGAGAGARTLRAAVDDEFRRCPVPHILLVLSHFLAAHADYDDALVAAGREQISGNGGAQAMALRRHIDEKGVLAPLPAGTTANAAARALLDYLAGLADPLLGDSAARTAFLDAGAALVVAGGGAESCANGIAAAGAGTAGSLATKLRGAVGELRSEKRAALEVFFGLLAHVPGAASPPGEPLSPNAAAADIARAITPALLPTLDPATDRDQLIALRLAVELAIRLWANVREEEREKPAELGIGE